MYMVAGDPQYERQTSQVGSSPDLSRNADAASPATSVETNSGITDAENSTRDATLRVVGHSDSRSKIISSPGYLTNKGNVAADLQAFAAAGGSCPVEELLYNESFGAMFNLPIKTAGGDEVYGKTYLEIAAICFGIALPPASKSKKPTNKEKELYANALNEALLRLKIIAGCNLGVIARKHGKKMEELPTMESLQVPATSSRSNAASVARRGASNDIEDTSSQSKPPVSKDTVVPGTLSGGDELGTPKVGTIADPRQARTTSPAEVAAREPERSDTSTAASEDYGEGLRAKYNIPFDCGIVPRDVEDKITVSGIPAQEKGSPLAGVRRRFPNKKDVPFVVVDDREVYFADDIASLRSGKLDPNCQRYYLVRDGQVYYRRHLKPQPRMEQDPEGIAPLDISGSEAATNRQMGASVAREVSSISKTAPTGPWTKPKLFTSAAEHAAEVNLKHPQSTAAGRVFALLNQQRPAYAKAVTAANTPPAPAPASAPAPVPAAPSTPAPVVTPAPRASRTNSARALAAAADPPVDAQAG